jgi:hypothetical protein
VRDYDAESLAQKGCTLCVEPCGTDLNGTTASKLRQRARMTASTDNSLNFTACIGRRHDENCLNLLDMISVGWSHTRNAL